MPKTKPAKAAKKPKKAARAKVAKHAPKSKPAAKSVKAAKVKSAKQARKAKPAKVKPAKAKPTKAKLTKANGAKKVTEAKKTPKPVAAANGRQQAAKPAKKMKLTPFLASQRQKLLELRDSLLDSMTGVAKDTLRARAEGSEASAFGMHQADAGSDAYDRDFALSLLSQEQDALYEIEEAIKRIDAGTYGTCEMSGKAIAHARLEALPFARYTVECQSQLEKQNKHFNIRKPVTSLFGLTDEEPSEAEEEEPVTDNKE